LIIFRKQKRKYYVDLQTKEQLKKKINIKKGIEMNIEKVGGGKWGYFLVFSTHDLFSRLLGYGWS
jgi:hypothetical protein